MNIYRVLLSNHVLSYWLPCVHPALFRKVPGEEKNRDLPRSKHLNGADKDHRRGTQLQVPRSVAKSDKAKHVEASVAGAESDRQSCGVLAAPGPEAGKPALLTEAL